MAKIGEDDIIYKKNNVVVVVDWACVCAAAALLRGLGFVLSLHIIVYDYMTNKC